MKKIISVIFILTVVNLFSNEQIIIKISEQKLYYYLNEYIKITYDISTSKHGIGNLDGSFKTPLGKHIVATMIGDGEQIGTIFKARRKTGETAKIFKQAIDLKEDHVITRIIRLKGLEEGKNKGKYRGYNVDSFKRNIYIHGTPEEGLIGIPSSEGCIRMRNEDIVEFFEYVNIGTPVNIIK